MNKIHYYKINYVIELMISEGKEMLDRILEKGNPDAQACEMWLPG
jgi:hypothetical protein